MTASKAPDEGSAARNDALLVLQQFQPSEPAADQQQVMARDVLAYVLEHGDALQRDCRPDHVTASALVLSSDGSAVMLDLHRKVGRWLQFGGHLEPGDTSLAAAALREAREESGIATLELWSPTPLRIDVHPAPCGARHHLDVQFVACGDRASTPSVSAESHDVRWFDVDDLPQPTDHAVETLVAAGVQRLRQALAGRPADGSPSRSSQAADMPSR